MYKLIWIILFISFSNAQEIHIVKKYQHNDAWTIELEASSDILLKEAKLFNGKNDYNLSYFSLNKNSTLYFLIDSSFPMKKSFLQGIKPSIEHLYKQKNHNNKWIISTFDTHLNVVYNEYNKTKKSLVQSLNQIQIKGKRTELWKNTLEAINSLIHLKKEEKKFLIIFSDGKAEDKAYTIESVVKEANENNITILSLGYRDLGTEKTNYIQNMERIALDSHGKFWNADKQYKLSKSFVQEFNNFIKENSSKNIKITLPKNAIITTVSGKQNFILTIESNLGSKNLNFILDVPKINTHLDNAFLSKYLYYILGAVFLLFLIFLLLKKGKKTTPPIFEPLDRDIFNSESFLNIESDSIAYFESLGGTKHYVYKLPSTIGSNADIVIEGGFISRQHAILDFKDGYFFIIDTNSSNKLFVEGEQVLKEKLTEGTKVSFGPYDTIFKIHID